MKLIISIVNFNTKDLTMQCLASVLRATRGVSAEVWVVDNGSSDGSVQAIRRQFPSVTIASLKKNVGFAAANNIVIKRTKSTYVLLLNSDTIVPTNTVKKMLSWMDKHENVGVATCRLEFPNGKLDPSCHRGFPTPWASLTYFLGLGRLLPRIQWVAHYHQTYKDFSKAHEIDSPSGAFYLVRRKAIDEVGLLDERFFMYAEDLDWSYRIKQNGFKIMFVPIASVVHLKGRSGTAQKSKRAQHKARDAFYKTMHQFYEKHYQEKYPGIVSFCVHLGIDLRWMIARMKG